MLGSKDGAEKDQYRKYLFFVCVCEKFTSDLMGNIFMIIRQNVLSPSPSLDYCVTFTWRVTCLFLSHTQTFFLLHVWMSLSWPLPLKLSSCFRLFTFALCGPFSPPPPGGSAPWPHSGRYRVKRGRETCSLAVNVNVTFALFISLNQMYL